MTHRTHRRMLVQGIAATVVLLSLTLSALVAAPRALALTLTVGDGTVGSCTEAAFDTQLSAAVANNTIVFNCDASDLPIIFTDWKIVDIALTIDGGGTVTLSGGDATDLFYVDYDGDLTLKNITLTDGHSDGTQESGAVLVDGIFTLQDSTITSGNADDWDGGAIANFGELTVTRSTLSQNETQFYGGAIINYGYATITDSLITDNEADTGGGIFNIGAMDISGSTISDNVAIFDVGGIENIGEMDIYDSTISGNDAEFGGGIVNDGLFEAERITISGNTAIVFAGFANLGGANLLNSTISGNISEEESVVVNSSTCLCGPPSLTNDADSDHLAKLNLDDAARQPTVEVNAFVGLFADMNIVDSTIADNDVTGGGVAIDNFDDLYFNGTLISNPAVDNCFSDGDLTSGGYNLDTDDTCGLTRSTDIVNGAANIAALANNGGPTETHALLATSMAVDGNDRCEDTDQRGEARPQGNSCDIGAYESSFFRDNIKPTTSAPTYAYTRAGIAQSIVGIQVSWTGADLGGSGIAKYRLERRVAAGTWTLVADITTTSTSGTYLLWFNHNTTYELRVRATDAAGNIGRWSAVTILDETLIQDDDASVIYTVPADWGTVTGAFLSNSNGHVAKTAGSALTFSFNGNTVAWIGPKNATAGTALVQVDGDPVQFVDLKSATSKTRRVIFRATGLADGPHTLTITTLEAKRVVVDAFLVLD